MSLVEIREESSAFPEAPITHEAPDLKLVSSAVIYYGVQEKLPLLHTSPGNMHMNMGLSPTEVRPAIKSGAHDFEQWFLGIPPIAHELPPAPQLELPKIETKQIGFGF
jgi:hypothetical protein